MTTKLLKIIGINPKRLRLEWISAAEGQKFASLIHEFTNELKSLGPFISKEQKVEVKNQ